jgi:uncharacterized protein with HEPN domain
MDRSDLIRIRHMFDAAGEITAFCDGKTKTDFKADRKLVLAVLKDLEIIGEAAARITDVTRSLYPGVQWEDIIGMRNRLIHGYFDVNEDIVWNTLISDLPRLTSQLRGIIDEQKR